MLCVILKKEITYLNFNNEQVCFKIGEEVMLDIKTNIAIFGNEKFDLCSDEYMAIN